VEGTSSGNIIKPGGWGHLVNTVKVNSAIPKGAKLKVYFWNKERKVLFLKNLFCRISR
jgi:hypothetical protein